MEDFAIPGIVLMENAARGIAAVAQTLKTPADGLVAIVCGPGNNGGDGLAVGRHLANAGYEVALFLTVPEEAYREGSEAAINLEIVRRMGLPLQRELALGDAGLVVDAIFGTGLRREVRDPFLAMIRAVNDARAPVLAVDLPSGLDADTGEILGQAVRASVTATMVAPKVGFSASKGPAHVGRVEIVDIGVPPAAIARVLSA